MLVALLNMGSGRLAASADNSANMSAAANVPTPISPNGTITDKTPTYKWSRVTGATKYRIQVYQGAIKVFSKDYTSTACSGSTCSGTPANTLAYKNYKWQARAYIGGAWKPWSAWMNFTVAAPGIGFNSQFTSDAAGWIAHKGVWSVAGGSYTTPGVDTYYASVSHANNYTTLTYQARLKRVGCSTCPNHLCIRGTPTPLDPDGRWNKEYKFAFSNEDYWDNTKGSIAVFRVYGASVTALRPWTSTTGINSGNWNTLKVVASGIQLRFYINGALKWSGTDSDFASGRVGIGMRGGSLVGDKLWVDWAKLATTVTDDNQIAEFLMGEGVPGGDDIRSP
jgi:hypothetical protein